jgi:site-specific DNA-methyltransferase (adenine-specific)
MMGSLYYDRGGITIWHGDCREVMPWVPEIDLVFTSPPYNLGNTSGGGFPRRKKMGQYSPDAPLRARGGCGKWAKAGDPGNLADGYGQHKDAMPHAEYVAWQHEVLHLCWNALSEKGAIFYNHKPRILDGRLVAPVDYVPDDLREYIRQEIIWKRAGGINFSPSFYLPTHERIVVIARRGWRLKSKGASGVGDVWTEPQEINTEHPAPFPIGLPCRAIETTAPGTVLDPFAGSGTTLCAAKIAGRPAVGIELEERWCELAAKRVESMDEVQGLCQPPFDLTWRDALDLVGAHTKAGLRQATR